MNDDIKHKICNLLILFLPIIAILAFEMNYHKINPNIPTTILLIIHLFLYMSMVSEEESEEYREKEREKLLDRVRVLENRIEIDKICNYKLLKSNYNESDTLRANNILGKMSEEDIKYIYNFINTNKEEQISLLIKCHLTSSDEQFILDFLNN